MALHQLVESGVKGGAVEGAAEPHGERLVVRQVGRFSAELDGEPELFLFRGERCGAANFAAGKWVEILGVVARRKWLGVQGAWLLGRRFAAPISSAQSSCVPTPGRVAARERLPETARFRGPFRKTSSK